MLTLLREAFGLYVHIPFCRRRCDYCAFATWSDRYELWPRYVGACVADARRLGGFGRGPATSVFFGGGTPSLLPADALLGILDALRESVGVAPGAEVTVECNPETVSAAKLADLRAGGVTRLSFGAQSMVPHVLASLGREHDPASVVTAARLAGEAGFAGTYSVDLIFGAAGETLADWRASLEGVLALDPAPAHVSAYALTVEPGTPLASDPARHPDDDDQADKYLLADQVLGDAGLQWYEISNWVPSGGALYPQPALLGAGRVPGAGLQPPIPTSLSPDGSARRWWNVRTPERYCGLVDDKADVEAAGETLLPGQRAAEALVLSLRTSAGVPAEVVPEELYERGLVAPGEGRQGSGRAVLTLRGRLLANEVAVRLSAPRPSEERPGPGPASSAPGQQIGQRGRVVFAGRRLRFGRRGGEGGGSGRGRRDRRAAHHAAGAPPGQAALRWATPGPAPARGRDPGRRLRPEPARAPRRPGPRGRPGGAHGARACPSRPPGPEPGRGARAYPAPGRGAGGTSTTSARAGGRGGSHRRLIALLVLVGAALCPRRRGGGHRLARRARQGGPAVADRPLTSAPRPLTTASLRGLAGHRAPPPPAWSRTPSTAPAGRLRHKAGPGRAGSRGRPCRRYLPPGPGRP